MKNKLSEKFELFVVNLDAGDLLENFFITSIATILTVRTLLYFTGYPQIGGDTLHIAHMLWGGLFLLIAMLLLLGFLSREAKETASVIGGIGFGLFIDELGKFITQNNDYFYEPAIMLIYLIFIIIFLALRLVERKIQANEKTYAINGLEIVKEVLLFDLDRTEKRKALAYLKKGQKDNRFVESLVHLVEKIHPHTTTQTNMFGKLKNYMESNYLKMITNKTFAKFLIAIFMGISLIHFLPVILGEQPFESLWGYGVLTSSTISLALVIMGSIAFWRGKRYLAFESFKYAAIVSIFVTQFFLFYINQLSAIFYLLISISMYIAARFLIAQERAAKTQDSFTDKIKSLVNILR